MTARRSLLLITVDCLRADHLGFMGYMHPTSPFLDSLAEESLMFPAAIVGGAPTYYSLPAILASRHPLALGRDVIGIAPGEPTLASVLQQAGYATAAFCAGNPYLATRFGYDQGFDYFRDFLDDSLPCSPSLVDEQNSLRGRVNAAVAKIARRWKPAAAAYEELYFQYCQRMATGREESFDKLRRFPSADIIVDQARSWVASLDQSPFFLWLHLMDPHSPYYPTEEALRMVGGGEITPFGARYWNSYWKRSDLSPSRLRRPREHVLTLYDAGIRWVDTQVARLVDALCRFNRWEQCLFTLTADHGEEFLDHQGRYHPASNLLEEIIRVPLLMRIPGRKKMEAGNGVFSHVDLAPTLLELLNVPAPPEFRGKSAWRQIREGTTGLEPEAIVESVGTCSNPFRCESRVARRMLAVRGARYKLLLDFEHGWEKLFDLESDPGEQHPLPADAEKSVRRRLLQRAQHHLSSPLPPQYPRLQLQSCVRDLQIKSRQTAEEAVLAYA